MKRTPVHRVDLDVLTDYELPQLQSIAKLLGIRAYGRTRTQLIRAIEEARAETRQEAR